MPIKTDLNMNNISQVFAIGDVHGCKSLLEKIHNKILKKSEKVEGNKILIYLGDYVDRGYQVKETINTIINFKPKDFKCIFIRGNHEQMLLDFVNGKSESLTVWLYNGGAETLKSYCGREISDDLLNSSAKKLQIREKFIKALPKKHLHFFNGLQFSYTWKDYFFVHAGIDPSRPLSKQRKIDMIWTRTPKFLASNQPFEKIIVHGHTPSKNVEKKINRINLDTGAVYSEYGKLSCMFIDAKENRKEFFASERGFL